MQEVHGHGWSSSFTVADTEGIARAPAVLKAFRPPVVSGAAAVLTLPGVCVGSHLLVMIGSSASMLQVLEHGSGPHNTSSIGH